MDIRSRSRLTFPCFARSRGIAASGTQDALLLLLEPPRDGLGFERFGLERPIPLHGRRIQSSQPWRRGERAVNELPEFGEAAPSSRIKLYPLTGSPGRRVWKRTPQSGSNSPGSRE